MSRVLQMPAREQFEFSDSDPRVIECQEVGTYEPLKPWQFFLIAAADLISVAVIVYGVVRAVREL